jgi:hypothetical protein
MARNVPNGVSADVPDGVFTVDDVSYRFFVEHAIDCSYAIGVHKCESSGGTSP